MPHARQRRAGGGPLPRVDHHAEQRAAAKSLVRNGRPTRLFRVVSLDEYSLGALLMHFMLETILAADLLGVDAFDQPAVGEGKVLARQYLGGMGRGHAPG